MATKVKATELGGAVNEEELQAAARAYLDKAKRIDSDTLRPYWGVVKGYVIAAIVRAQTAPSAEEFETLVLEAQRANDVLNTELSIRLPDQELGLRTPQPAA